MRRKRERVNERIKREKVIDIEEKNKRQIIRRRRVKKVGEGGTGREMDDDERQ